MLFIVFAGGVLFVVSVFLFSFDSDGLLCTQLPVFPPLLLEEELELSPSCVISPTIYFDVNVILFSPSPLDKVTVNTK